MSVEKINVETGEEDLHEQKQWYRVGRVLWTKNADELLITAADYGSAAFQIWKIFLSKARRKTLPIR